ncbi:MAG: alpha/beta fold hydrolase [Holophagales bacterium]|nr:alpha/beta fold hydrolase [Holophagales bacterium]
MPGRSGRSAARFDRAGRGALVPILLVLLTTLTGCLTVRTVAVPPEEIGEERTVSALTGSSASQGTAQFLRLAVLEDVAEEHPDWAIRSLVALYDRAWGPSGMLGPATAAAEVAVLEAKKLEAKEPRRALGYYLAAAELALDAALRTVRGGVSALGPRARFSAELYNFSVGRVTVLAREENRVTAGGGELEVTSPLGPYRLVLEAERGILDRRRHDVHTADSLRIRGLRNRHRSHGLGSPVVVNRRAFLEGDIVEAGYYPSFRNFYGLSAVLRFETGIRAFDTRSRRDATLTLHDPLVAETVSIGGVEVPLEADYTSHLALAVERVEPELASRAATLRAERYLDEAGLFLIEPYRPEKIPLVLVHGLQSSALTWAEMINDLRGDPVVRRNYQIWAFGYPTGLPVSYSAELLRRSLERTLDRFDPERSHRGTSNIVLVGHSMGGLISRLLVTRSGDRLWSGLSERPFDSLELDAEDRDVLRRVYFSEPLRSIARVVFLATPHRGARLARGTLGRMVAGLVRLPAEIEAQFERLGEAEAWAQDEAVRSDGIDNLSPDDPLLRALDTLAVEVPFHTVAGDRRRGEDPVTDGVVDFSSSQLSGARSELVVESGHNVHQDPAAIAEVRRILLEHLCEVEASTERTFGWYLAAVC